MGSAWQYGKCMGTVSVNVKKVDKADNGKKEGISFEAPEMLSSAQGIEEKKGKGEWKRNRDGKPQKD